MADRETKEKERFKAQSALLMQQCDELRNQLVAMNKMVEAEQGFHRYTKWMLKTVTDAYTVLARGQTTALDVLALIPTTPPEAYASARAN